MQFNLVLFFLALLSVLSLGATVRKNEGTSVKRRSNDYGDDDGYGHKLRRRNDYGDHDDHDNYGGYDKLKLRRRNDYGDHDHDNYGGYDKLKLRKRNDYDDHDGYGHKHGHKHGHGRY
ncbi:hypothetical protein RhiirA5_484538 [Rhizophagus irregularis]|uniref:Uncharacterized protein n=1 Tax=Rhizophagus irregularis TaxID=588596 RepID=A0A2I1DWD4_9GLOM|nr:hypothetical protein RhiirA5_484538 [Rhizophagus irregularis]PKC69519.1 hypothetical protein RhiirA1_392061 [Rhizophagus irregularis]PKY14187.1 hypothetical protein RhiirB3_426147 [Rhizophagus irregularis]CAB4488323.1 unnamed protein product [Rhizophagus irregularis]CAB5347284.1 unnamed protein product [Rhizophagus irregularis]